VERKADQVVAEIRATRARLGQRVGGLVSLDSLVGEVRTRPAIWIGGGVLAGVLFGRFWGGSLLRQGRQRIQGRIASQVKMSLGAALLAALGPQFARGGSSGGTGVGPSEPLDRPRS
jgi:hypothetical protein